jgi:hypothetical protein
MYDVMVDLETLGNTPGCVILSIGAVGFNPETGEVSEGFYAVVRTDSCTEYGLHTDKSTVQWWGDQSEEARKVIREAAKGTDALDLPVALGRFAVFLDRFGGKKNVRVWGNGSDFDNAILAAAYRAVRSPTPWEFWNSRRFRTFRALNSHVPAPPRVGTFHNALDDAQTQVVHALQIYSALHSAKLLRPPVPAPAAVEPVEEDLLG